ncbi:MAG: protein-glutamate O-methyltransferase [Pseudomonadota bacterium]
MNDFDFKFFEALLRKESGLAITPEKIYLLESRLLPIVQKQKIQGGLEGLAQRIKLTKDADLQRAVVEAMTTNETSFFRDSTPFQRLKEDLLPYFSRARGTQKTLRIWSAACSSGQEPYSIAMLLREYPALAGWRFEIVATDLSLDILAQARSGVYSQFEVQRGLPIQMLVRYFTKQGDGWAIKPEVKDMVKFRPANLLGNISELGSFDIVFCRNVLIYFDVPTKVKVLAAISGVIKPDGVLFLGGAETVIGVSDNFRPVPEIRGIYVRQDSTFTADRKTPACPPAVTAKTAVT